jgi:hypothetical protein
MRRLIVFPGSPKCGSTSIQTSILKSVEENGAQYAYKAQQKHEGS